jgi:hypothetical protein
MPVSSNQPSFEKSDPLAPAAHAGQIEANALPVLSGSASRCSGRPI